MKKNEINDQTEREIKKQERTRIEIVLCSIHERVPCNLQEPISWYLQVQPVYPIHLYALSISLKSNSHKMLEVIWRVFPRVPSNPTDRLAFVLSRRKIIPQQIKKTNKNIIKHIRIKLNANIIQMVIFEMKSY